MKHLLATTTLILALATASFAAPISKAGVEPDAATCATLEQMMEALEENDYQTFVANGEDAFKAALTKEVFDKIDAQLAPRLKTGYYATYLTQLSKRGYVVSVWKVRFEDGGDDLLGELSIKNGKVGGFFLR